MLLQRDRYLRIPSMYWRSLRHTFDGTPVNTLTELPSKYWKKTDGTLFIMHYYYAIYKIKYRTKSHEWNLHDHYVNGHFLHFCAIQAITKLRFPPKSAIRTIEGKGLGLQSAVFSPPAGEAEGAANVKFTCARRWKRKMRRPSRA